MFKVVLIIGLPGSGKTFLALNEFVNKGYFLIDDPKNLNEIKCQLGKNLVITDPHLCDARNRDLAEKFFVDLNYEVSYIFFENDEEKCLSNIKQRNDARVIKTFKNFNYKIPSGVRAREIWQSK